MGAVTGDAVTAPKGLYVNSYYSKRIGTNQG